MISWVISAWRAWFSWRVSCSIRVWALSVADFIARWRLASSEAADIWSAKKTRFATNIGNSASSTVLGSGSYA